MPDGTPARLPALTGLRFFAAFGVLIFHYGNPQRWYLPLRVATGRGEMGVVLFFLLSGFVLGYTYFPAARAGTFQRRGFWVARLARIYPVYLAAFLLQGLWMGLEVDRHRLSLRSFLASGATTLALVQSWTPWARTWNEPGWTLSVEALFYLAFPLLLAVAKSRRATVLLLLVGAGALSAGGCAVWLRTGTSNPLIYIPMFVTGLALARWHERRWAAGALARLATPMAVLTLVIMAMPGVSPGTFSALAVFAFAALLIALAQGRGACARLLSTRPLLALGEASYALYILQLPLWGGLRRGWLVAMPTVGYPRPGLNPRFPFFLSCVCGPLESVCSPTASWRHRPGGISGGAGARRRRLRALPPRPELECRVGDRKSRYKGGGLRLWDLSGPRR